MTDRPTIEQWLTRYDGTNAFVLSVQAWYAANSRITPKQREALKKIRYDMERQEQRQYEDSPLGIREKQIKLMEILKGRRDRGEISNTQYAFEVSMMQEHPDYLPGVMKVFSGRSAHRAIKQRGVNK